MGRGKFQALPFRSKLHVPLRLLRFAELFENTDHVPHVIQRWKAELLQFGMDIEHQSARMMWECDLLTRYNMITDEWREKAAREEEESNAVDAQSPTEQGTATSDDTEPRKVMGCFGIPEKRGEKRPVRRLATLSSVCYHGEPTCPTLGERLCDPHRSVIILTSIGARCPYRTEVTLPSIAESRAVHGRCSHSRSANLSSRRGT